MDAGRAHRRRHPALVSAVVFIEWWQTRNENEISVRYRQIEGAAGFRNIGCDHLLFHSSIPRTELVGAANCFDKPTLACGGPAAAENAAPLCRPPARTRAKYRTSLRTREPSLREINSDIRISPAETDPSNWLFGSAPAPVFGRKD